jgi:hypothetical protein
VYTTPEEKLIASQFRLSDPHLNCLTRLVRQFELDGALCLALHDDSAGSYATALCDVAHSRSDEITAPQLAVNPEIEKRQIARYALAAGECESPRFPSALAVLSARSTFPCSRECAVVDA